MHPPDARTRPSLARGRGRWLAPLAALGLGGCQLILGFEDFERGGTDAGSGGTGGTDAAVDATTGGPRDAGVDGGTAPCALSDALDARFGDAGAASAPSDTSEDMVEVRRPDGSCFLIDRLEVSLGQYGELLAGVGADAGADDGPCTWKAAPSVPDDGACGLTSTDPALPVTCIDWCDARRYCRWRGLELCRGEFASEAQTNAGRSDWFAACSNGGDRVYPYGDRYDGSLCNGEDNPASGCPGACAPFDVTHGTGCAAASGALNLSGNAAEWTAACRDNTGASDSCRVRGGSYRSPAMGLQCDTLQGHPRDRRQVDIGFRCCFYAD